MGDSGIARMFAFLSNRLWATKLSELLAWSAPIFHFQALAGDGSWLSTGNNHYNDCSGSYGAGHSLVGRCNPIGAVPASLSAALQKAKTGAPSLMLKEQPRRLLVRTETATLQYHQNQFIWQLLGCG